MSLRSLLNAVAGMVPERVKVSMRGDRSSPTPLANAIHAVLNRLPGERYPVLACSGILRGYRMRIDWSKHRSFVEGTWEPEVVQSLVASVSPGMTALDLGAHSGFFVLLLARLVGPAGQVFGFEPIPANYRFLEQNVTLNELKNAHVVRKAVGANEGEILLEVPPEDALALAGPMLEPERVREMKVPVASLDHFVSERNVKPDFIMMDVEGAEGDVLEGAKETINTFHPMLMIELHGMDSIDGPHPVAVRLQQWGYQTEWLSEIGYTAHTFSRWKPG